MSLNRIRSAFFFAFLAALGVRAEALTLSGEVLEKGSKAPVVGASLYLEPAASPTPPAGTQTTPTFTPSVPSTTNSPLRIPNFTETPTSTPTPLVLSFSADTDLKGRYQVTVPEGVYRLTVAGEGFEKVTLSSFAVPENTNKDFFLAREGFTLPEVVVSTTKDSKIAVSHEVISKEELTSVPGTGGDVLRALQSLPGVATAGDFSGQLIVRGGGPEDNLYLVDRIPIAFPFHFGGLISTVNSDFIKNVDFSAGGFGPEYGNFWGGVIDITQRDARRDRWGARADINLIFSEGLVEGPITANSSLAVAGRRSYLEVFGSSFFKDFTAVPSFGDYQVKYSYDYSPQTHWDFQAFGSDDQLGVNIPSDSSAAKQDPSFAGLFELHDGFNSQGVNYRRIADDQNTLLNTLYHYNFFFDTHFGQQGLFLNINDDDFGDWFSWRHDFDKDTQLEAGVQYDHAVIGTDAYFPNLSGDGQPASLLATAPKIRSQVTTDSSNLGTYFDQKFKWFDKKVEFSVGARMDWFQYKNHVSWGPRFAVAYLLSDKTTLKASYGDYYQLPIQGSYLDPNFGNPDLLSEKAISTILGVEQKLNDGLYLRVEGYNKDLTQIVVSDPLTHYSNFGYGYSRGVEFFLRRPPTERFFGWISYAFSDSIRHNSPGDTHVYDYDQPNIATVVASYKINPGWDVGIKWRYSTGLPDNPVVYPFYTSVPVTINSVPVTLNSPVYGPVNSTRLPDYQRLDFSTSFTTVYNTWQWRFYVEILNVTNNANVLTWDYNSTYSDRKAITQIPFFPYLGFEAKY